MMEVVPYTSVTDGDIEALTNEKLELMERKNNGIEVKFFWQRLGNICTIFLRDERENAAVEFVVPNDEVMVWFNHPFAHRDAVFTKPPLDYERGESGRY